MRAAASLGARTWFAVVVAMTLGLVLRLWPWDAVFGGGLHLLMDGDPWYHLLRAQELARTGHLAWVDPMMNAPFGADVPWPPLFDAVLAAAGWAVGGGHATDASVALAAALVPPILGVALVALLARLAAATVGPEAAAPAAFAAALFGWHVDVGLVGRPDQHVAELLLLVLALDLLVRAAAHPEARGRRLRAAAAGLALAAGFWNWLGSGLYVGLLVALWGAWHVLAPREDPRRAGAFEALLLAGATAAGVLVVSIAWLGPPGALAHGGLAGMTAMPAALCGALTLFAGGLWLRTRRDPGASRPVRAAEVLVLGVAAAAALAAPPPLRAGLAQGLTALRASNGWYAQIREFQPIVGSGLAPLADEAAAALGQLGLVPLLAIAGAFLAPALVRGRPERRFGAFVAVAGFAAFLPLAVLRARFGPYLGIFAVLLAAAAARRLAERAPRSWRPAAAVAVAVLAAAPCVRYALVAERRVPVLDAALELARVAGERARTAPRPGQEVVLGAWGLGHHLRAGSGLPVVATPFGTEGGAGALEDAFRWFGAEDDAAAAVEDRRGVRFVVVTDPFPEIALGASVLPGGARATPARLVRNAWEGPAIELTRPVDRIVSLRLFLDDGGATGSLPALSRYRLLGQVRRADGAPVAKLFEIVRRP